MNWTSWTVWMVIWGMMLLGYRAGWLTWLAIQAGAYWEHQKTEAARKGELGAADMEISRLVQGVKDLRNRLGAIEDDGTEHAKRLITDVRGQLEEAERELEGARREKLRTSSRHAASPMSPLPRWREALAGEGHLGWLKEMLDLVVIGVLVYVLLVTVVWPLVTGLPHEWVKNYVMDNSELTTFELKRVKQPWHPVLILSILVTVGLYFIRQGERQQNRDIRRSRMMVADTLARISFLVLMMSVVHMGYYLWVVVTAHQEIEGVSELQASSAYKVVSRQTQGEVETTKAFLEDILNVPDRRLKVALRRLDEAEDKAEREIRRAERKTSEGRTFRYQPSRRTAGEPAPASQPRAGIEVEPNYSDYKP